MLDTFDSKSSKIIAFLFQSFIVLTIAFVSMKVLFSTQLMQSLSIPTIVFFFSLALIYLFATSDTVAIIILAVAIPIPTYIELGYIGDNWIRIIPGDLFLGLLLVRALIRQKLKLPSCTILPPLASVFLLGFLTLGKASLFLKATIVGLFSYMQSLKFLSYLIIAIAFTKTSDQLRKFITALLISQLVVTVYVNFQRYLVTGSKFFRDLPTRGEFFSQEAQHIFGWPGFYAVFCAMLCTLSIEFTLYSRSTFYRILGVVTMISGFCPIIFSESRTAYLCFMVALLMMSFRGTIPKRFILITSIIIIVYLFPGPVRYTFSGPEEQLGFDFSSYTRLMILKESMYVVLSEPLLGYGFNRFRVVVAEFFSVQGLFSSAHNFYLRIMVKNGILGLLAYLWLIKVIIMEAVKMARTNNDFIMKIIARGFIYGTIGMLVSSFTQSNLHYEFISAYTWFTGGSIVMINFTRELSKENNVKLLQESNHTSA